MRIGRSRRVAEQSCSWMFVLISNLCFDVLSGYSCFRFTLLSRECTVDQRRGSAGRCEEQAVVKLSIRIHWGRKGNNRRRTLQFTAFIDPQADNPNSIFIRHGGLSRSACIAKKSGGRKDSNLRPHLRETSRRRTDSGRRRNSILQGHKARDQSN